MTTISTILAWKTEGLAVAAQKWQTVARLLESTADDIEQRIGAVSTDDLSGEIRDRAEAEIREAGGRVRRDSALVSRFAGVLGEAGTILTRARDGLRDAVNDAEADGLHVDDETGAVSWLPRLGGAAIDNSPPRNTAEHSAQVTTTLNRARVDDAHVADQLLELLPPGRQLFVPGVDFAVDDAMLGLPQRRSNAIREILGDFGRGADAEVKVVDATKDTTTIMVGDAATAETVVTIVAGTGSSPEDLREQVDKVRGNYGDNTAVAVMAYNAPSGIVEAASASFYTAAAPDLQRLQSHLAENANAKLIVIGHSYGSTVVAQATTGRGLHADGVVLAASPGVGRAIKTVDDMTLRRSDGKAYSTEQTRERVTAITTEHDIIRMAADTALHGVDPTDPRFMARAMGTRHITNGQDPLRKYSTGPHSDDYFPDYRFRSGVRAFANSLPGSGPGT